MSDRNAMQVVAGGSSTEDFDLRDLARSSGAASASLGWPQRQANGPDEVFSVLGVAGAKVFPMVPDLGLLGVPGSATLAPADVVDSSAENNADPATRLLAELHAQFVRVVRDPTQLTGRTDWEGQVAVRGEVSPSMNDLHQQAAPFHLLRDILKPPGRIDEVLNGLGDSAGAMPPDSPVFEDVLQLFAPALARDAKPGVPSLTRRDHHAMSPDSHMNPGGLRATDSPMP